MISFRNYLKTFNKKFVCLFFTEETNKLLYDYAIDNNFDLSVKFDGSNQDPKDFNFHITIFFTNTSHNTPETTVKLTPFEVKPTHFELLGEEKDIPVIKIKSERNILRIRQWFEDQGYKDSWPTFNPHISLSYKRERYKLAGLQLPDFPIIVDRFTVKNQ